MDCKNELANQNSKTQYFSEDVKDRLKIVFDHFKDLKNDKVDVHQLRQIIDKLDVLHQNILLDIVLKKMVQTSTNNEHLYNFDEFILQLENQLGNLDTLDGRSTMFQAMSEFQNRNSGSKGIGLKEFKEYMEFIGFDTSDAHDQKWEKVFRKISNGNDSIDKQQFQIFFNNQQ